MSAEQHRAEAKDEPVEVRVVTVSSTRTAADDRSGALVAELLESAGHRVTSRTVVDDDVGAITRLVEDAVSADVAAVVLTGGTGLTGRDVTPEAVEPLFSRRLDGFGELFRSLSYGQIGAAAMASRACAGLVGRTLVFALPGSTAACRLAVEMLIAPELPHLVHLARKDRDRDGIPTPTRARRLQSPPLQVALSPAPDEQAPPAADEPGGWQRAISELRGTVLRDQREALPEPIEKLAPVVNVLEQAGEAAVLEVRGRRWSLWGFPDLRRPDSKVLAVGHGGPLAEVIALHRHPIATGTCVEGPAGLGPPRSRSVRDVAEDVVGRAPPGDGGALFATSSDAIWYERGGRVFRWDGVREREEGTPKQALASLVLGWSQR